MPAFNILDFGAVGDGQTNDGPAIPWTAQTRIGRVRRVSFVNILSRSENGALV